jgi:hypothetical protein
MSIPEPVQKQLLEEFEKHLESARACPMTPGSLEKILIQAAEQMAHITQQALAETASTEADFSPSGMPPLRRRTPLRPESEAPAGGDGNGDDSL